MSKQKSTVLVLLSGGLDSTLAVKTMLDQDLNVEVAIFSTPFCLCDKCSAGSTIKKFGVKAHSVLLGQEYLDLICNPTRGYGSQMNPCVDCRIFMMKKAKELANEIGAECLVTGEVLDQRPFSQTRQAMKFIEKKAGLEGKILRPLSAKLLEKTDIEKNGLVERDKLYSIQGRRRLPQMDLAKKLNIGDYPCPSGGCLLTDPRFADRLRDHLNHKNSLTIDDVSLLRLGRHFRVNGSKIIVGRNKDENEKLLKLANRLDFVYLEVVDYLGPVTVMEKTVDDELLHKAAGITMRYSDVENCSKANVRIVDGLSEQVIEVSNLTEEEIENYIV